MHLAERLGLVPTGSASEAIVKPIQVGDLVLSPDDPRPWRVLYLYAATGYALIEQDGDAWTRTAWTAIEDLRPVEAPTP